MGLFDFLGKRVYRLPDILEEKGFYVCVEKTWGGYRLRVYRWDDKVVFSCWYYRIPRYIMEVDRLAAIYYMQRGQANQLAHAWQGIKKPSEG